MVNIPVVFCFDARIILGASVAIKSLIDCAKNSTCYNITVFHSDLSNKDQKNIASLLNGSRHSITFHYINPEIFKKAPHNNHSWTELVYYRLLIPDILSEYDKVIYSDVDVLFKKDLEDIYNMDLENYEAAAIPTTKTEALKQLHPKRYFEENTNEFTYQSCFIIFNNKLLKSENIVEKTFNTIKTFNKRLVFFDLDTFNLTYKKIKAIPINYCIFETFLEYTDIRKTPEYKDLKTVWQESELIEAKNNPAIIHFAGCLGKPWQRSNVPFYYQQYIDKLPKTLRKYTIRDIRKRLFSKKKYPEQHFDVGIVNFYFTQNYGACLTAYALQEIIKSFGLSCAFVNEFSIKKKYKSSFGTIFTNKYLKLMPRFNSLKQAGKLADVYITGSDQVFRPEYLKKKIQRDAFLLKFVDKNAKKMAFAASFGVDDKEIANSSKRILKEMKKELEKFNYISTRELSGVKICKDIFELYAQNIPDPVFLADKELFLKLADNSDDKYDYSNKIVSYILDKNVRYEDFFTNMENKYHTEVVDIKGKNISPESWLKAIIQSGYIITDSFHGVCFAILFNKPFIALNNKKRGSARFETLKALFGYDLPILESIEDLSKSDFKNYNREKINTKISELKEKGLSLLKKELCIKNKSFITDNCTGCGACYNICPCGAVKTVENFEGFLYPEVNRKLCTNCFLCKKICPENNKRKTSNETKPQCYAVMAQDEIRESGCSSGGASFVFMNEFIKNKDYAAGAIYDENFRIIHCVSNNKDFIDRFKGSKYFQSNTLTVYKEIKNLLEESKKVLFTGTPCQVAGLKSYLQKDYDNLLTVDIVCHGVPSYKTFKKFSDTLMKNDDEKILSVNFRDKLKQGWKLYQMILTTNYDGYCFEYGKNPFMTAFLKNLSIRKSCFRCKFQKIPRQGDITIGDFWRIHKFDSTLDDDKGTSLVLINNKKGEMFFNKIKNEFKTVQKVPLKYAIKGNKTLIKPVKYNSKRNFFMLNVSKNSFSKLLKDLLKDKFKE